MSTSRRVCIVIDFAKAFDNLRWDAIDVVMELMGLDQNFRNLVMSCVSTASVSALVEGSPTEIIKLRRGLRQGNPLSPLLCCNSDRVSLKVDGEGGKRQKDRFIHSGRSSNCEPSCFCR